MTNQQLENLAKEFDGVATQPLEGFAANVAHDADSLLSSIDFTLSWLVNSNGALEQRSENEYTVGSWLIKWWMSQDVLKKIKLDTETSDQLLHLLTCMSWAAQLHTLQLIDQLQPSPESAAEAWQNTAKLTDSERPILTAWALYGLSKFAYISQDPQLAKETATILETFKDATGAVAVRRKKALNVLEQIND